MPNGGQLSAGSGLRLQATTPGTTDIGNAHFSGTMLGAIANFTGPFGPEKIGPVLGQTTNVTLGSGQTWSNPAATNYWTSSVVLGDSVLVTQNPNGNQSSGAVVIGSGASIFQGRCVVVGSLAKSGASQIYPTANARNVAIGYSAQCDYRGAVTEGGIAIGGSVVSTATGAGTTPSIVFGFNTSVTNTGAAAFGGNVVIGAGITLADATNNIIISTGGYSGGANLGGLANTIIIGDATHTKVVIGGNIITGALEETIFKATASATVANSVAETSLIGAGVGSTTIDTSKIAVGKTVRFRLRGIIGDTGTPTLQIRFKIGGVTVGDTGAVALTTIAGNHGIVIDGEFTYRTLGNPGTILGNGNIFISSPTINDLDTTKTAADNINTTVNNVIDVTAQWGTANAANTLTITNCVIEFL